MPKYKFLSIASFVVWWDDVQNNTRNQKYHADAPQMEDLLKEAGLLDLSGCSWLVLNPSEKTRLIEEAKAMAILDPTAQT